jgi:hypothetical protein
MTRAEDLPPPGGDFTLFVTRLGFQALLSLGLMENPVTGERHQNLGQARLLRDDLEMLRTKTAGNLDDGEQAKLDEVLQHLSEHISAIEAS